MSSLGILVVQGVTSADESTICVGNLGNA
jgi:hypothetical protein